MIAAGWAFWSASLSMMDGADIFMTLKASLVGIAVQGPLTRTADQGVQGRAPWTAPSVFLPDTGLRGPARVFFAMKDRLRTAQLDCGLSESLFGLWQACGPLLSWAPRR